MIIPNATPQTTSQNEIINLISDEDDTSQDLFSDMSDGMLAECFEEPVYENQLGDPDIQAMIEEEEEQRYLSFMNKSPVL